MTSDGDDTRLLETRIHWCNSWCQLRLTIIHLVFFAQNLDFRNQNTSRLTKLLFEQLFESFNSSRSIFRRCPNCSDATTEELMFKFWFDVGSELNISSFEQLFEQSFELQQQKGFNDVEK